MERGLWTGGTGWEVHQPGRDSLPNENPDIFQVSNECISVVDPKLFVTDPDPTFQRVTDPDLTLI
jgi:hypothetical protein